MSDIKSNIWKLSLIKIFYWFILFMPTIVLFYQENGLSMKEVFILQAAFSVAIVLFEIPSGYFADVFGRKFSIIIGCTASFFGLIIYSFSYGFVGFLFAEIIFGVGSSFISGADSALLYDSLVQIRREKEYKKMEGRVSSTENFSEGAASILGGFLAVISLRVPFYINAILIFFTIPIALTLIEPIVHKYKSPESNFKNIQKIVKYSLHDHSEVKWLIVYSSLVFASTLTMVWFTQPYLKSAGLPLAFFGIVWATFQFSVGIFSLYAYKFELKIGRRNALISLIVLSTLGYLTLSLFQGLLSILFIFIFYFVRGINGPVIKDYINKLISSDIRATVLSVQNLIGRLIFSVVGPIVGWINDLYSLKTALLFSGAIFLFCGTISLLFLHKHKAL